MVINAKRIKNNTSVCSKKLGEPKEAMGPSDRIYRTMEDVQFERTALEWSVFFKPLGTALDDV